MRESEPPAVTFALFAYNQEAYVAEAVAGALAQRCDRMEIILSDDCSSDRTHAIMTEMAASYAGPHHIRVRREPVNVGTVQHVINVAREAHGALLVVAAGDDISYPDRASKLYSAWRATGAAALASFHDEIDADGAMLRTGVSFPHSAVTQWLFAHERRAHRVNGKIASLPGFCAAYPQPFWAELQDPPSKLLVEDGLAGALIIFRGGRIHRIPESLIAYRLLDSSLTDRGAGQTLMEIRAREQKIDRHAHDSVALIDYILNQARRDGTAVHHKTRAAFGKGRAQNQSIADFWSLPIGKRLLRLASARSLVETKYIVPRLFGFRGFAAARIGLERWRLRKKAKP